MARKKAAVEYNDFTGGFITEASPLTYPENASLDENNVNINNDGSRQRRYGMDWTDGAAALLKNPILAGTSLATSSYTWLSAGNDGTQNLAVLQHGYNLYFYDLDADDPSDVLLQTLPLAPTYANQSIPFTYATAYGKLVVSAGTQYVNVLSYDGTTVTTDQFRLMVRDRWGIDDGLAVDTRPLTLSTSHFYNLRNQGYPDTLKCVGDEFGSTVTTYAEPIAFTFASIAQYPSNADLVWSAKLSTIAPGSVQVDNIGSYSPWELLKNHYGTTPAPQGKFIIDLFIRNDNLSTNSRYDLGFPLGGTLPIDTSSGYVSSVAAFAGRIWYTINETGTTGGDDNTPIIGNMVLYSQATEDFSRWSACHTRGDPTSEEFNDVLASDGGFISIPEAGRIYKMIPLGESLFILASNGVWEIFGGDNTFSAKEQSVQKITDAGTLSPDCVVTGSNFIGYWSDEGIYGISISESTLRGVATNITESTIQEYYDDIPENQKKLTRGSYDRIGKKVVWLYNLEDKGSDYYFDRELVFDVQKAVFTKRYIKPVDSDNGPYITTAFSSIHAVKNITDEDVTDGAVVVTDGGLNVTIAVSESEQKTKTSMYYWVSNATPPNETFRIASYSDFNFIDYPSISGGIDASAFILTGYLTGGDSSRTKWSPYISVKSRRTESDWSIDGSGVVTVVGESSCTMQAQWQWTNNALAGYWSTPQQVYRLPRFFSLDPTHSLSFDVINTRNKVKGSGDALSLKFTSEPLKDMHLLGWGIDVELDEKV